jgi:hypothetical protein
VQHRVQQCNVGVRLELQVVGRVARELALRGTATISFTPALAAFSSVAATGWFTVGLAPMRKITSEFIVRT